MGSGADALIGVGECFQEGHHVANLGLGLRWSAALAEIEAYEAIPAAWRAARLEDFDRSVRAGIKTTT